MWYRSVIGADVCPIVDTWWQTETGAMMISLLPGVTARKPGSAMRALPGIGAAVVDDMGVPVPNGGGGYLVLTQPWPSMLRGIWGDDERYKNTYWSRWPQYYFAGDGAKLDEDGAVWLLGRVDDVMNASGHRISTTEVESALVSHPRWPRGSGCRRHRRDHRAGGCRIRHPARDAADADGLVQELRQHVGHEIGPIAKPRY